jgi:hypothetical protein
VRIENSFTKANLPCELPKQQTTIANNCSAGPKNPHLVPEWQPDLSIFSTAMLRERLGCVDLDYQSGSEAEATVRAIRCLCVPSAFITHSADMNDVV